LHEEIKEPSSVFERKGMDRDKVGEGHYADILQILAWRNGRTFPGPGVTEVFVSIILSFGFKKMIPDILPYAASTIVVDISIHFRCKDVQTYAAKCCDYFSFIFPLAVAFDALYVSRKKFF
jgi:hypothetical protein